MDIYNGKSEEKDAEYLLRYINDVLIPSSQEFFSLLDENKVALHHAFSFNAILAHAIDYMVFISNKMTSVNRKDFIHKFDEKYYVDGCAHINNKFRLLDAVNNSFKHVELHQKRYPDLIEKYGELNFHSLKANEGKIFFKAPFFSFDYCRVVMRPIAVIFQCGLQTTNDVDDFINGRICGSNGYGHFSYDYEPHDAIDRMIDACNPECMDCGEYEDDCDCPNFIYGDNLGDFNGNVDSIFDFEDVVSHISGTREWSK
ncbi:hypothetical protein HWA77_21595 [Photobacterium damselae subsp. damselae]|uniref:Uncharacterized protein n=1 Tax=Photobacterium damselae subsp. damselae TaxID=85581 RepID=A0A850QSX9_PHODD|nr:hypothetical protein [Photobacterium damselae subsp. damselae]